MKAIIFSLILGAFLSSFALADGFPIKNGRYQGKITVLTLTDFQIQKSELKSSDTVTKETQSKQTQPSQTKHQ